MRSFVLPCVLCVSALTACGDDGSAAPDPEESSGSEDPSSSSSPATTLEPTATETDPSADSSTTADPTTSTETTAADSSSSSSTGEPGDVDVAVRFALRVGDEPAACGQSYDAVGTSAATVSFRDLRFYVSNLRLLDDAGNETVVALTQDDAWQYESVALLDFEDATGECETGTTAETNDVVVGTVPPGEYVGVRFELGVPFELNHLDITAPSPLNDMAMAWAWASGRKFVRIDMTNENEAPGNGWFIHLGSQGCESAAPTEPPAEACGRPALPTITLDGFDAGLHTVVGDIAALLADEDVNSDTPESAPGCMSFAPDVNECDELFPHLGLSWETGTCESKCAGQDFFSFE
jgi:uncharacterized repeat protein (TIGR04052 family)